MLSEESISFPTFEFFRAKSLKVWCDENGLILTCKITTDLRKMASIRRSFFKLKHADIQLLIKLNSHLGVTCRLGLLITSKKGVFLRLKAQKNKARKKELKQFPFKWFYKSLIHNFLKFVEAVPGIKKKVVKNDNRNLWLITPAYRGLLISHVVNICKTEGYCLCFINILK